MKPVLERRVAGAFLIALLCVTGIGIVQYFAVRKLNQNSQLAAHSQAILIELRSLRTGLNRQDAAAQTYALTGDAKYLALFPQAKSTWDGRIKNLRALALNEPAQQGRIDRLETSLDSSYQYLQAEIDLKKTNAHPDQMPGLVASVEKSLDDSRNVITELENTEIVSFGERNQAVRRTTHEANLVILFGGAVGIALLGGFAIALYGDVAERTRSEAKFRQLLESAPDAMTIANRQGKIVLTNQQAEKMFGYSRDELFGRPVEILVAEPHQDQFREHHGGYFPGPENQTNVANLELRGLRKNKTTFPIEVRLSPLEAQGEMLVSSAIRDTTERDTAAEMIEAQAKLLDAANDAIFVRTAEGKISYWNGGAERLYGWTKEDALGKSPSELVQTRFPISLEEIVRQCERGGDWRGVLVQRRRDGTKISVGSRWNALKDPENKITGWLEVNRDITERVHAENELRAVSGRLLKLQEDERRHIGRELHDSLGQYLSVLKMNLDSLLPGAAPGQDGAGELLTECIQLADRSLTEVRTASYLLYPPLLDELGLQSATSWYLDGFAKRSGIQTTHEIPPDLGRMDRDVELAFFRILQESLTNVHRHSGSSTAHVRVAIKDGEVTLEVQDGGKGIPQERLDEFYNGVPGKLGVGLRGMHERIRQFGGTLEVLSNPQGTTVRAAVPFVESKAANAAPDGSEINK